MAAREQRAKGEAEKGDTFAGHTRSDLPPETRVPSPKGTVSYELIGGFTARGILDLKNNSKYKLFFISLFPIILFTPRNVHQTKETNPFLLV